MVTALTVLRLVIDDTAAVLHLHLAGVQVTLEVLHIRLRIPQAPFHEGIQLEPPGLVRRIAQCHLLHLCPCMQGHKEQHLGLQAFPGTCDTGVSHTVAALILVQGRLAGFPSGRPYLARLLFPDIEVAPAVIHGYIIITVAGDAAELAVLVERVASGRIADKGEEILVSQIIDPRERSGRLGDDKLPVCVIKETVLPYFFRFHVFFNSHFHVFG